MLSEYRAYVTIGDLDEDNSKRIISDFPRCVHRVQLPL